MAALYSLQYAGQTGGGAGAIYVGNGIVAGFDTYGGRFNGTYTEQAGRFRANVTLLMPGGGQLVTGQAVPAGTKIPMSVDWPAKFGNGTRQQIMVQGRPMMVLLKKMQDIP